MSTLRLSRGQLRALQYLYTAELRRPLCAPSWIGEGTFRVAPVTVSWLVSRKLARVITEPSVKRAKITEAGRQCIRRLAP